MTLKTLETDLGNKRQSLQDSEQQGVDEKNAQKVLGVGVGVVE